MKTLKIKKRLTIDEMYNAKNERNIEATDKKERIIMKIPKDLLIELYNFAYKQAEKTNTVSELQEIDRKINYKPTKIKFKKWAYKYYKCVRNKNYFEDVSGNIFSKSELKEKFKNLYKNEI